MKLSIEQDDIKLQFERTQGIDFPTLFKAYQLITGSDEVLEDLSQEQPEPEQQIETNKTLDAATAVKQEVAVDVDSLASQLQKKFAGEGVVEPKAVQTENKSYSDKVRVDLQCPFCGIAKAIKVPKTLTFIKCPGCNGKIFLSWATGVKGEVDEHSYYYKANSPMQFKNQKDEYKEMFGIEENDQ